MERQRMLSIAERRAQIGANINAATQKLQSIDTALQKANRLSRAQGALTEFTQRQELALSEINQELQSGIYTLPDGTKVTVGNEKAIQVLEELPTDPEHAIPSSTLANKLFRWDLERKIFDLPTARSRTAGVVSTINNRIFPKAEVEWEVRNASSDFIEVEGRRQRPEATYYLARKEKPLAEGKPDQPALEHTETREAVELTDSISREHTEITTTRPQQDMPAAPAPEGRCIPDYRPSSPTAIITPAERQRLAIRGEARAIFRNLVGTLPDAVIDDVAGFFKGNIDDLRRELAELAQVVVDVREGKISIPTPLDFLGASTEDKGQLAERTLHGIVAQAIIPSGEYRERDAGLKMRLGREANRLKFLLGQRNGKKMVLEALEQLPHLERILIERSMSTSLKYDLDFPDLYECDEEQFAEYIVFAARFDVRREFKETQSDSRIEKFDEQIEKLGTLLDSFGDRTIPYTREYFDGRFVIDAISQREDAREIFNKMIYAARAGQYLDLLENFFQTGEAEDFAIRCRQLRKVDGLTYGQI